MKSASAWWLGERTMLLLCVGNVNEVRQLG